MATAQHDFRQNDRDGNGTNDFWHGDLADLYFMTVGPNRIELIERTIADADVSREVPVPKAGYLYKAIRCPDGFAACSFPDPATSLRWTFIINHDNVMYKKDLDGQGGIDVWPNDPRADGWSLAD